MTLKKDSQNLIGISIGGGAQYCPCLYIVQVGTWGGKISLLFKREEIGSLRDGKCGQSSMLLVFLKVGDDISLSNEKNSLL